MRNKFSSYLHDHEISGMDLKRAGFDYGTVSEWKNNHRKITKRNAERLCKFLGVTIEELGLEVWEGSK